MREVLIMNKPERNVSVTTLYSVIYGVRNKMLFITFSTDLNSNISKNNPDTYIKYDLNIEQIQNCLLYSFFVNLLASLKCVF